MAALFVRETPHVHSEIYLFPRVYHEVLFTMYHPLFLQSVENERKRPARTLRAFVIQHLTNQGTPLMPRDGTRGNLPFHRPMAPAKTVCTTHKFTWKLVSQEVPIYLLFLQLLDEALLLEAQQDDVDVGLEGGPRSHADAVFLDQNGRCQGHGVAVAELGVTVDQVVEDKGVPAQQTAH